ncbi:PAS domain S-box protein [Dissulfurirhabdus thermomarina]|uniref:histidine kinase n=1 Tax=Dissulfurirhabdus thermomarina TaxID=1765737 RepID=A0A6N9TPN7_DISTH|nr:ATP-binding protein [Dissulfurirhabdus thermomarina]NDY41407.1 PAS domain S-box protein [Dissulfurirhabdus thermomarina]NMX24395.1 PAS domain S-box protein [Dissulfurirhabdus thermomarina]
MIETTPRPATPSDAAERLRLLYRSARRMGTPDELDVLFGYLVEDIVEATGLERLVALSFDEERRLLETRVFYGFDGIRSETVFPLDRVDALLRKAYVDREPMNVLPPTEPPEDDESTVRYTLYREDFEGRRHQRRRHINLCLARALSPDQVPAAPPRAGVLRQCSLLTVSPAEVTADRLLGRSPNYLVLPICDETAFHGFVLGDKARTGATVTYEEARLAAAIADHSAAAIGRARKQNALLEKIARQNADLQRAHEHLTLKLEEIGRLKSFYESIVQNLRSGLVTVNQFMRITHLNKAAEEILGYRRQELMGRPLETLFASEIQGGCLFTEAVDDMEEHCGFLSEYEMRTRDGRVIPVEACLSTITDQAGEVSGMTCIFRDITERRLEEQRLARIDRLASLGELAAGIAHEIRNPLAGLAGALQVIAKDLRKDGGPPEEVLDEIFRQIGRLDGFVTNLLVFARPFQPRFSSVNVDEVIESALFLVSKKVRDKDIRVELDFGAGQPPVQGDPSLLQQVFLNLVLNAVDAMAPGGTLSIHTCWPEKAAACRRPACISPAGRDAAGTVRVVFRDTGHGIPAEALDAVFNPFYTTKSGGTGLGLAISHRFIEQHDGTIRVDSTPGEGTVFTICLPTRGEEAQHDRKQGTCGRR